MLKNTITQLSITTTIILMLFICSPTLASNSCKRSNTQFEQNRQAFVYEMVDKYDFLPQQITNIIFSAKFSPEIIYKMQHPLEKKPWGLYKQKLLTSKRIADAKNYQHQNAQVLAQVQKCYGVDPRIITAIIGIETNYGKNQGNDWELNTLTTLAFAYPPRAKFFHQELIEYLLLTRDLNLDPFSIRGSYAGALGYPQFMPSSYRHYAVDFNHDHDIDLFHNNADAIASVANYLQQHGWHKGERVAVKAHITGKQYKKLLNNTLKPIYTLAELEKRGVQPIIALPRNTKANLIRLKSKNGYEYWIGLNNFYVITQYNTNINYAMAVYMLAYSN